MRRYLALTCAALVAAPALALAAPVRGVVVDEAGAPVAEAAVVVAGVEVATDARGQFAVDDAGPGVQDVLVVADGFEPLLARAAPVASPWCRRTWPHAIWASARCGG